MCMTPDAPKVTPVANPPPVAVPEPLAILDAPKGNPSLAQLKVGSASNLKLRAPESAATASGLTIKAPGTAST